MSPIAREPVELRTHPDGRVAVRGRHGHWTVHLPGGHVQVVPEYMITHAAAGWRPAIVAPAAAVEPCARCGARETNGTDPDTCAGCGEEIAA